MDIEFLRTYCLSKPAVTEDFPFDEETLVFKVCGKIFLLTDIHSHPVSANLKCEPEYAVELRDRYHCIRPGYHMNKVHWNTVTFDDEMTHREYLDLIDHSYNQVVKGLPKKLRDAL